MGGNKFQKNRHASYSFHLERDNSKPENLFMNLKTNIRDDQTEYLLVNEQLKRA